MTIRPEICTQMGRISAPQFSGISLGLIRGEFKIKAAVGWVLKCLIICILSESRTGRARREESPEFEQLQAQIDALRY